MDALETVQVTLSGRGQRNVITHPYPNAPSAPVIDSLSPATAGTAGGTVIEINGRHFTGATAVDVAGTPVGAGDFAVVSDTLIVFNAPAESAGAKAVTVVTGAGTSAGVNLTYS
jgi:hypothetical protein